MRARTLGILAALLCVGVVVASAAAAPPAGINKDPTGTAVFAHWFYATDPGEWFTVDGNGIMSPISHGAVSRSMPILIDTLWAGQAYGHTKVVPNVDRLKMTITKDGASVPFVQQTWAQGRAAWTEVFVWDSYWVTLAGENMPFNPNMGTGAYGIKWANLFPKNTFDTGRYHVVIDEDFTHVYNDLASYSPDWKRPTKITPYTATYDFYLDVVQ